MKPLITMVLNTAKKNTTYTPNNNTNKPTHTQNTNWTKSTLNQCNEFWCVCPFFCCLQLYLSIKNQKNKTKNKSHSTNLTITRTFVVSNNRSISTTRSKLSDLDAKSLNQISKQNPNTNCSVMNIKFCFPSSIAGKYSIANYSATFYAYFKLISYLLLQLLFDVLVHVDCFGFDLFFILSLCIA